MTADLLSLVAGLEPVLRARLSAIAVCYDGEHTTAHLSFLLFTDSARGVDTSGLPAGVHVTGRERWPDIIREVTTAEPIEAQIRALDRSGLMGRLDASRFTPRAADIKQYGSVCEWVVKTHAGSDAERRAWALAIEQENGPP